MSWLFSQALVEAFSGANSSDGEPSAPLSVMPTPHKFWRNDKTMEPSRLSQFGLTCAVLTEDRGAELLMSFLEASRARTSARPVRAQASTESDPAYGLSLLGSLARFDPASSLWKTPHFSLLGDSEPFSETWPRWGSMRNGASWARTTPALPTVENGSGFWPTPRATEGTSGDYQRDGGDPNKPRPTLKGAVKMWPTPGACEATGGGHHTVKQGQQVHLRDAVKMKWPTPLATDGKNGGPNSRGSKGDLRLSAAACQFPSPAARDWKSGKGRQENGHTPQLPEVCGGQLNPNWVEWLMGWPIGWTDLKPLETARFQKWPRSHSEPSTAA